MYESMFGLKAPPFQLNPDPAFLYASKGHLSAQNYLRYGVYQGEGFIVVTGEIGAGKTTIVRALLGELDAQQVLAAQLVSTHLDSTDVLRAICNSFGIPSRGLSKAELLGALEGFLTSLALEERRALLVVDEAQNLTLDAIEELRMLSNFQLGSKALLQSFLVGQPELRLLLRSPNLKQFRERVIASCHLGPLDMAETGAYVEHRLRHVGWNNDPRFEAGAMEAVFHWTGGVPRKINLLCNRTMLAAFLAGQHVIGQKQVDDAAREARAEISGLAPIEHLSVDDSTASFDPWETSDPALEPVVEPAAANKPALPRPAAANEARPLAKARASSRDFGPLLFVVEGHADFLRVQPLLKAVEARPELPHGVVLQASPPLENDLTRLVAADMSLAAPQVYVEVEVGSHAEQTTEVMPLFELIIEQHRPTAVVLMGDSNATLACSTVAAKRVVPVIHLRAGLRSFDRSMSEEINRVLIEQVADLLFTVDRHGQLNLKREGIKSERVHFVGSILADAIHAALPRAVPGPETMHRLGVSDTYVTGTKGYGVVMLNSLEEKDLRRELTSTFATLRKLSKVLPLVWPMQESLREGAHSLGLSTSVNGSPIACLPGVRYLELLGLLSKATYVLTDASGVQEEATVLGVPCLTMRSSTEQRATVSEGTNTLVGENVKQIMHELAEILDTGGKRGRLPELWDGQAAGRIADTIERWITERNSSKPTPKRAGARS